MDAEIMLAPATGATNGRQPTRLTSAASESAGPFPVGKMITIQNGSRALAYRFGSSAPTAVVTDVKLGPYGRVDFQIDNDTTFLAVIDAASGTHDAHYWLSSPV